MMRLRGPSGNIKWAWHRAASLGPWTIENDLLTASVSDQDELGLSQQPLVFEHTLGGQPMRWPIQSLQVSSGTLTAVLRLGD
jgi:hypothetical protein